MLSVSSEQKFGHNPGKAIINDPVIDMTRLYIVIENILNRLEPMLFWDPYGFVMFCV